MYLETLQIIVKRRDEALSARRCDPLLLFGGFCLNLPMDLHSRFIR